MKQTTPWRGWTRIAWVIVAASCPASLPAADEGPDMVEASAEAAPAATAEPVPIVDVAVVERALKGIRPAGFQKIIPGISTRGELEQANGPPPQVMQDGPLTVYNYQIGPFPSVEFLIENDLVVSVIIHLKEPSGPIKTAKELKLTQFRPTPIIDDSGVLLGQAFPERAIIFHFDETLEKPAVAHIMLDRVTAEPFLLRAQATYAQRFRGALIDLAIAERMQVDRATVASWRARILAEAGRFREAEQAIEAAINDAPDAVELQLVKGRVALAAGRVQQARGTLTKLATDEDARTDDLQRAEAQLLLGTPSRKDSRPTTTRR